MMWVRLAVCDDEPYSEIIEAILVEIKEPEDSISTFASGLELLGVIREGTFFDAIFLDIEMPWLSGIEVAREIRAIARNIRIIFVTAYPEYSLEAHSVRPFAYLTKPVTEQALTETLDEARKETGNSPSFQVITKDMLLWIPVGDIDYVDVRHRIVTIHHRDGNDSSYKSLSEVRQQLEPYGFFHIHRSILVNVFSIRKLDKDKLTVIMKNGDELPISSLKLAAFKRYYARRRNNAGSL